MTAANRPTRISIPVLAAALLVIASDVASAQAPLQPASAAAAQGASTTEDDRWRPSFDAFTAADKLHAPRAGGVLFVGSSSIRLWNDLEREFETAAVIKRGFGGSRMADCARYVDQLVLPYRPRLVIVYAGDNDLAEGRSPQQVLQSFTEFVQRVRHALPETRIAYLSIKPSPLRVELMPSMIQTNALIASYAARTPNLDYIDVYSKMLDSQGQPRADLFLADSLHLNAAGYAIWKAVISEHLGGAAPQLAMPSGAKSASPSASLPLSPAGPGPSPQPTP